METIARDGKKVTRRIVKIADPRNAGARTATFFFRTTNTVAKPRQQWLRIKLENGFSVAGRTEI